MPHPPSGDLPDPGIEPASLTSLALAGGFFTTSATWEIHKATWSYLIQKTYVIFSEKYPTADTEGGKVLPTSWLKENLFVF